MAVRVCRWGIISTAGIVRKNWEAIGRAGNASIQAVSSRNRTSAEKFIADCQSHYEVPSRPRAYDDYRELIADPEVDAVYVPLPTGLRKQVVIAAAEHGKHVMCEKPCAVSYADLREMIDACHRNGVQFMDGVMYMHTERLQRIRDVVDDPEVVGTIKRIATQFSFCAPEEFFRDNIRVDSSLEPQGCLGDLGWYTIRFALWVMKGQLPHSVRGSILSRVPSTSGGEDIPVEFSGEMYFDNGVSATMYNSFLTGHQQWAVVSGTRGLMQVNDFVLPVVGKQLKFESRVCEFNRTGWDFDMELDRTKYSTKEKSNMGDSAQETLLFRTFSNLVLEGTPDPYWPEISLKTQLVLDAMLASGRADGERQTIAPIV